MPSRVWSHLCEEASTESGKINIIGIFNSTHTKSVPLLFKKFFIISMWAGTLNEKFSYCARIISPNNQEIAKSSPLQIIISDVGPNNEGTATINTKFNNVPFEEFGEYAVEFLINEIHVFTMTLTIFKTSQDH